MDETINHDGGDTRSVNERLRSAATRLQHDIAMTDCIASMLTSRPSIRSFAPELIVLELPELVIRMDGNRNHHREHVHVDLGKNRHAASYALDTGDRLAGKASRYDREIRDWIVRHQADLVAVWRGMRASGYSEAIVVRLRGSGL